VVLIFWWFSTDKSSYLLNWLTRLSAAALRGTSHHHLAAGKQEQAAPG
jgi:hypothetical protein